MSKKVRFRVFDPIFGSFYYLFGHIWDPKAAISMEISDYLHGLTYMSRL